MMAISQFTARQMAEHMSAVLRTAFPTALLQVLQPAHFNPESHLTAFPTALQQILPSAHFNPELHLTAFQEAVASARILAR